MDGGLQERVDQARWYHTIELPGGIVTPGEYDLRESPGKVEFPATLTGYRCLDVGTRDGFWAFEMEKRGAAEVVGIDLDDAMQLDWPLPLPSLESSHEKELEARLRTFDVARDALNSSVQRLNLSVYKLSPEEVGEFDFAFIGTLLHHLRDPVGALIAIRRVVRGQLLVAAVVSLGLSMTRPRRPAAELLAADAPFWWVPNIAGLRRIMTAAGFEVIKSGGPFLEPNGAGAPQASMPLRLGELHLIPRRLALRYGAIHVWMLAEPR